VEEKGSGAGNANQNTTAAKPEMYYFMLPEINQDGIDEHSIIGLKVVFTSVAPLNATNGGLPPKQDAGPSVGVGASFAFNYVNREETAMTAATIGSNRVITTGTLSMVSLLQNDLKTTAVAGADPLSDKGSMQSEAMDVALDAAVAIGIISNKVYTSIARGTTVTATKSDLDIGSFDEEAYRASLSEEMTEAEKDAAVETAKAAAVDLVSVYMLSEQEGHTLASASAFAIGAKAAVGACVATNYADSDVKTDLAGTVIAAGKARLLSRTFNGDDAFGTASALDTTNELSSAPFFRQVCIFSPFS
jgi:hypothetical protein